MDIVLYIVNDIGVLSFVYAYITFRLALWAFRAIF